MKKIILIAICALLVMPVFAAARAVDETREAAAAGVVTIELLAGEIRVAGWERAEVRVKGTIDDDAVELDMEQSGQRTTISVKPLGDSLKSFGDKVDLEIHMPRGSRLEVESLSADVTVEAIDGAVTIEAVSGEVNIAGALPEAEVSTMSGNIVISSSAELRGGEIQSVSGDIVLKGMLSADGRFGFQTVSGNIELHLPSSISAEFEVETLSGDIRNDFGPAAERSSQFFPSKSLEFSIGGGGASVSVTSVSGNVNLIQQ
jgi:hypothetical protein